MTLLVLLLGCVTRENYVEKVATVSCQKSQQCDPDAFAASYDDVDQCSDFIQTFVNALDGEDCTADCAFSSANASACLSSLRSAPCDEVESGEFEGDPICDEIYDCEGVELSRACGGGGDTG